MWSWLESRSLFERLQASTVALYQCAYGADYRKPTRLTGTWANLPALGFSGWPRFESMRYVGPLPKKCGHQHEPLLGKDSQGRFRTRPTAAYGSRLCTAIAESLLASTPSSSSGSSGDMVATDEALEATLPDDPEQLAQAMLARQDGSVPLNSLLRLFDLLPGEAPSRGLVLGSSKSFVTGAYAVGGSLAGLRKLAKSFPYVTKLLCSVVRSLDPSLRFTSVGIFRNLQTSPHQDSGNQKGCPNLVAAISSFAGGGIWLESEDGTVPCPFETWATKGRVLELPLGRHVTFDPRLVHCTMPWHGADRVVLVAFAPFFGPSLSAEVRGQLYDLGFNLPVPMGGQRDQGVLPASANPGSGISGAKRDSEEADLNDDSHWEWWKPLASKDRWIQDPEGSTSEEDEDGHAKPKRGSGRLGFGAAMTTNAAGKVKLFSDGHGLASPGRWPPHARPCAELVPELSFHKVLMDRLLAFITKNLDYKKVICYLATGKCAASPFSAAFLDRARALVFTSIRDHGSRAPLDCIPERQPFFLHAISEMLKFAGDPDWRQYTEAKHSFANGVPLGVDFRMPRTPALFERKRRHRDFAGLGVHECEELRDNYKSVEGFEDKVEQQFEKEIAMGAMVKMSLDEAQRRFGDRLSVASLGCIPKSDDSVRVVHDGTHGQHVNDSIKVRDGQSYPSGADLEEAMRSLPFATFSLSGDVSRAHRLVKVREEDWARQSCRARRHGDVYLNTVGTFGISSASYWWFRLMSGLGRLLYYCHGKDETTLLFLCGRSALAHTMLRILASILLLTALGVPFAWHKFSGGGEHSWIGYSLCIARRTVGISLSRAEWVIGWIRKTRSDGLVRVGDVRSGSRPFVLCLFGDPAA